jgi:hypothetical protein
MKKLIVTAIYLVSIGAFAQTEPTTTAELEARGTKRLDQERLATLIQGNTLLHEKIKSSIAYDMWYRPDGNRVFYTGGPNIGRRFEGWYKIKDGKRCELSTGGGEVCFTVYPIEEDKYFLCDSAGKCDWTFTVEEGNSSKLE